MIGFPSSTPPRRSKPKGLSIVGSWKAIVCSTWNDDAWDASESGEAVLAEVAAVAVEVERAELADVGAKPVGPCTCAFSVVGVDAAVAAVGATAWACGVRCDGAACAELGVSTAEERREAASVCMASTVPGCGLLLLPLLCGARGWRGAMPLAAAESEVFFSCRRLKASDTTISLTVFPFVLRSK